MRGDRDRLLDMIEMCDLLVAHAYFHIDQDIVGSIVSDEIPDLRRHLAAALDHLH